MTQIQGMSQHVRRSESGGSGALLGAAAGDVLAAGSDRLYGLPTQHCVITAYHLLEGGSIDPDRLGREFVRMAFPEQGRDVYRAVPTWFLAWLQESRRGSPVPLPFENSGAAARMAPIGVWFRKDPAALIDEAIRAAMVTHNQSGAVIASCTLAGAVAGASFGQAGRDLVLGTAEVARRAEERLPGFPGTVASPPGSTPLSLLLRHAALLVGQPYREVTEQIRSWTPDAASVAGVVTAIVLGAPISERPSLGVREAVAVEWEAREVAVMTGAIVGARAGPHRWPWKIPNDLWFAEIGRRLANHDARSADLPDVYAVEDVVASGGRPAGAAAPS